MQHRFSIPFVGGWTTVMDSEEFNKKKEQIQDSAIGYLEDLTASINKNPKRAVVVSMLWGMGVGAVSLVAAKALVVSAVAKAAVLTGGFVFSGVTAPIVAAKVNDWCDCTDELYIYVGSTEHSFIDAN
jgi:hypothetical protein